MGANARDVAIVFADVSGSTALYEKLGDEAARAAVASVLDALRKSVALHGGRVVKTIGDEVMAALPSADAALVAACDMQVRVSQMAAVGGVRLAVRIGFHFGPAIETEGDFYGDVVNVASRMAGLAKGSQIITSAATAQALSASLRNATRDLDTIAVKGKRDEMRISEVLWRDGEDLTIVATAQSRPRDDATLTLGYGGRELMLGAARASASLGRDASNDLAVSARTASRTHAKIEYRHGKFFVTDQSTNGTYVTVGSDREVVLKREQALLRGRGVICLGHSAGAAGAEPVTFAVEQAPQA